MGYRILLIEDNPGDSELIEEMLSEIRGIPFEVSKANSLLEGLKYLSNGEGPDLILVDLYLTDSQGMETLYAVQTHAQGVPIVVLTGMQSDDVGVVAVARGAQDFLVKAGLTSEILVRSVRYAMERGKRKVEGRTEAAKSSRSIGFMGVKGGVGTTSLACHFASGIKRSEDGQVLAADLDLEGGALGFLLQSSSTTSIADAIENLHHLDEEYWKRVVSVGLGGLHVLKSPAAVGRYQRPTADVAACVLRFARGLYPWTVVDLGRASEFGANVAVELDDVFLVTTGELVSLQATKKTVESLRECGLPQNRIHLIQNRGSRSADQTGAIEEVTGIPVYHAFPDCQRDLGEAYVEGRLASHNSGFAQSMDELVGRVSGRQEVEARSWMSNFKKMLLKAVA